MRITKDVIGELSLEVEYGNIIVAFQLEFQDPDDVQELSLTLEEFIAGLEDSDAQKLHDLLVSDLARRAVRRAVRLEAERVEEESRRNQTAWTSFGRLLRLHLVEDSLPIGHCLCDECRAAGGQGGEVLDCINGGRVTLARDEVK